MQSSEDGAIDLDLEEQSKDPDLDIELFSDLSNTTTQSSSPFSPILIPPSQPSSYHKPKQKLKPEDLLLKTATESLTYLKQQQERMIQPNIKADTEQLFADYIARSIKSISDEKLRRRAEFKIHAVLYECMSEEDRRPANPSSTQQFSSFIYQPQTDFQV